MIRARSLGKGDWALGKGNWALGRVNWVALLVYTMLVFALASCGGDTDSSVRHGDQAARSNQEPVDHGDPDNTDPSDPDDSQPAGWTPRGGGEDPFGDDLLDDDVGVASPTSAAVPPSLVPPGKNPDAVDVTVYYATSRARGGFSLNAYKRQLWIGGALLLFAALMSFFGPRWFRGRWKFSPASLRTVTWLLLLAGALWQVHEIYGDYQRDKRWGFIYTGDRRVANAGEDRYTSDLGQVTVSVPLRRERGTMHTERWWKGEFIPDPVKHFVLTDIDPQAEGEYFQHVRGRVTSDPDKSAFVFIHGYNTTFERAALRTAQIAHDLQFKGAPIFYSWPSDAIKTAYFVDRDDAEWGSGHLREFLKNLKTKSGAEIIHLVAHSMGTRCLCKALRDLEPMGDGPDFQSIILAAPDLDADAFENEIAPRIGKRAHMVTLYASANDEMIKLSSEFNGNRRVGDATYLAHYKGYSSVDAIDVSGISQGHSYMGNNGRVLSDVRAQLIQRLPAKMRPGLRWVNEPPHWILEDLR